MKSQPGSGGESSSPSMGKCSSEEISYRTSSWSSGRRWENISVKLSEAVITVLHTSTMIMIPGRQLSMLVKSWSRCKAYREWTQLLPLSPTVSIKERWKSSSMTFGGSTVISNPRNRFEETFECSQPMVFSSVVMISIRRIFEYVIAEFQKTRGIRSQRDPMAVHVSVMKAEKQKELSSATETEINLITMDDSGPWWSAIEPCRKGRRWCRHRPAVDRVILVVVQHYGGTRVGQFFGKASLLSMAWSRPLIHLRLSIIAGDVRDVTPLINHPRYPRPPVVSWLSYDHWPTIPSSKSQVSQLGSGQSSQVSEIHVLQVNVDGWNNKSLGRFIPLKGDRPQLRGVRLKLLLISMPLVFSLCLCEG